MMELDISSIIKQDLAAIQSAFEDDDFRNMNVFSNRIMTDAVFGNKDNFVIIGFFLKDMALIYEIMKAKKELTTFSTAKSFGTVFLKSITKTDIEIEQIWKEYHKTRIGLMEHQQNEHEKGNYSQNFEFSNEVFVKLINMLKEEKNILLLAKNKFLEGINSEMERIFKVHGAALVNFYAMALTGALQLYYQYVDYYESLRDQIIETVVFPYVNNIIVILEKDPINPDEVNNLLIKLISEWRFSFIRFMERPKFVPIKQDEELLISEDTKKKISETVAKVLEQEVK
ncbi:MAG: hypothetical protein NUK62_08950 [Tenericutes bacterium]|nr:hypothetical protein [Mycoplasmatota bacterium]